MSHKLSEKDEELMRKIIMFIVGKKPGIEHNELINRAAIMFKEVRKSGAWDWTSEGL
jgi:hypothetical protein